MHRSRNKMGRVAAALLVVLAVAAACCGCTAQSKQHMFAIAGKAVKEDPSFPSDGVLHPIQDAEVYVAKNVASVRIPFDVTGVSRKGVYTVWLKRVAIRWEVDRVASILPGKAETPETN